MRARNIKPGFYKNEGLADLAPLVRLLFSGLWGLADREGRLEDRPKRIKVEVLPYDDCDVDLMLQQLADAPTGDGRPFIVRYEVDGKRLIWIPTFLEHQTPHSRERASELPAYDPSIAKAVPKHDQGDAEPVLARARTDSGFLNPDCGFTREASQGRACGKPTEPDQQSEPSGKRTQRHPDPQNGTARWVAAYVDARQEAGSPASEREKTRFGEEAKKLASVNPDIMCDTIARMVERGKGPPLLGAIYGDVKRESEAEIFNMQVGGGPRVR